MIDCRIPLHIRCTNRHLIDPTYPDDDAKWWKAEETKTIPADNRGQYDRDTLTPLQQQVYAWLCEKGEATGREIATQFGLTDSKIASTMLGLSVHRPVYEYAREDGKIVYGVLTQIDRVG